jgi:hypothetical protein
MPDEVVNSGLRSGDYFACGRGALFPAFLCIEWIEHIRSTFLVV